MQKNIIKKYIFLIYLILIFLILSIQGYSYLSESEKYNLNVCPLITYFNITGEGIIDKGGCFNVIIGQSSKTLNLTTSCDEDYIQSLVTSNTVYSKLKQKGKSYILSDFISKETVYRLSRCIKNGTSLDPFYIRITIKLPSELEREERENNISKKLGFLLDHSIPPLINNTNVLLNRSKYAENISNYSRNQIDDIDKK